jgi:hypothetical protein
MERNPLACFLAYIPAGTVEQVLVVESHSINGTAQIAHQMGPNLPQRPALSIIVDAPNPQALPPHPNAVQCKLPEEFGQTRQFANSGGRLRRIEGKRSMPLSREMTLLLPCQLSEVKVGECARSGAGSGASLSLSIRKQR